MTARRAPPEPDDDARDATVRLDKWLWAARMHKTRSLAADDVERGRVQVNGQPAKPARPVRVGDVVAIRQSGWVRTVAVRGLSAVRGPAPVAQALYEETAESLAERERAAERRRLGGLDPAASIVGGRPTKRERRDLGRAHDAAGRDPPAEPPPWQRWSASIDDD